MGWLSWLTEHGRPQHRGTGRSACGWWLPCGSADGDRLQSSPSLYTPALSWAHEQLGHNCIQLAGKRDPRLGWGFYDAPLPALPSRECPPSISPAVMMIYCQQTQLSNWGLGLFCVKSWATAVISKGTQNGGSRCTRSSGGKLSVSATCRLERA